MSQRINQAGLNLIKESEGLRLETYLCAAGVPSIGYGSTGPHVKPGLVIIERQAEELLQHDLARFETGIARLVKVPLTSNQFSALCSLAFNIGLGNLESSTLLKKLNAGDYAGAAAQFSMWVKATVKGKKVTLPGLVTRRAAERDLFLTP